MKEDFILTFSAEETAKFATELAKKIAPGSVVALYGELGAGKTVFARGFARGLGIGEVVSSPTFTIVQEYTFKRENKGFKFYHIDLYRINSTQELFAFGIDEILSDPNGISLIEWAERLESATDKYIKIRVCADNPNNENERKIIFSKIKN